ncbi:MAG: oligopeptide:H+ symporter [Dermabacter sp.]|nr:oligopeptide:H+ symporter [Dermabacter sp.]
MRTTDALGRPTKETGFFGHPSPLANLFGVEMWERFSFYGMQGILAIYMYYSMTQGGLGIDERVATGIVGGYGGSVYVFSIFGAIVSDRILGAERTVFYSGVLIMLGHIALALIPGVPGLIVGLLLVAVGSGGLKSTISTLVGTLYSRDDPRRDGGFSIFYMGVNIGGLLGPLLTGVAQKELGFHFGFGLAAIGMAAGLVQYLLTRKRLPMIGNIVPNPMTRAEAVKWLGAGAVALAILLVLIGTGVVNPGNVSTFVAILAVSSAVVIFAFLLLSKSLSADEHSRVIAFIPMFIGTAAFFALFQQQFTVLAVYSDTRINRVVNLGFTTWEMPVSWPQSFNPFFIILFAPLFAWMWTKIGTRAPNTPVKFGIGIILMGSAFLLFLPMAGAASVPVLWVALIMLVATWGELMLSPVGLSLATKLAPRLYPVLMMALFNLALATGTALSGTLAGFYSAENETVYFGSLGAITIGIGVLMLAVAKPIHRAMRGIK